MFLYHSYLKVAVENFDDDFPEIVALTLRCDFESGNSTSLCTYIATKNDMTKILDFFVNNTPGTSLRLDGVQGVGVLSNIDIEAEDITDEMLEDRSLFEKYLYERCAKASMIFKISEDCVYVSAINAAEESEVDVHLVDKTNIFDFQGISYVNDFMATELDELIEEFKLCLL